MAEDTTSRQETGNDARTEASNETDRGPLESETVHGLVDRVEGVLDRRSFLRTTATTGVGLGVLSIAGSTSIAAQGNDDSVTDLDVLNYALTLEQLEATFYERGQKKFSESEIENSKPAHCFGKELRCSTYEYFNRIRDHERTHVEQLTTVINDLGGDPVSGLEFEFPFETVEEYFGLAQTFENLGVSAYDGAIALIDSGELQTAGATIATVEARHASYLNLLNGDVPFPDAFDQPKSMEDVRAAASEFIVGP